MTTDADLRAEIVAAGWTLNVERPEKLIRDGNNVTVEEAHYSASKQTRPLAVALSLKQLADVCFGSDAAVAGRKPEPGPVVAEVPVVVTLEDLAARVADLEGLAADAQA